MDEDLRLYGGVFAYELYLFQAKFPGQHRPGQPHLGGGLHPCQIMYAHLGTGVDGNIRQSLADGLHQAKILNQDGVCSLLGGQTGGSHSRLHLPVSNKSVKGHIYLAAPDPAITYGFLKFLVGKVLGAPAGIEVAHSHIYCVRTVLHGGDDRLRRPGGGKQFQHLSISPIFVHYNSSIV